MPKKSVKIKVVLTVLFSVIFVSLLFMSVQGGGFSLTPFIPSREPLYDVTCTVKVVNPLFELNTPARFDGSPSCSVQQSGLCLNLPKLSVSGGVHLIAGGKSSVESFEVGSGLPLGTPRSVKKDVTVNCIKGGQQSVKLRLITDNKNVLDEKSVDLLVGG